MSVCRTSIRIFVSGVNLSISLWIFTKLGVCIDIVEIWFGIVNGQISLFLTELSARDMSLFQFRMITLVNVIGFSPNLMCTLLL